MEILMFELGADNSVPWTSPHPYAPTGAGASFSAQALQGRGFFSDLGAVRRKPSRADAKPTLSKSCTDKLSVRQVTGLLSFPAHHFIAKTPNAYLSSLILPAVKHSEGGFARAFSPKGRLSAIQDENLPDGYSLHPFKITPLPSDFLPIFPFSKPLASTLATSSPTPPNLPNKAETPSKAKQSTRATNLSAFYMQNPNRPSHLDNPTISMNPITETLLNGVHQGYTLTSPSAKKASIISRFRTLQLGREIASSLLLRLSDTPSTTGTELHLHLPAGPPLTIHQDVVAGWRALVEATTYAEAKRTGGAIALGRERAKGLVTGVLISGTTTTSSSTRARAHATAAPGRDDAASRDTGSWPRNDGDEDWILLSEEQRSG